MRHFTIFLLTLLSSLAALSQSKYRVSYHDLKAYEGLYEYANHSTLKIAASPKDTLLYAIINQSRYPLRPSGRDSFLNNSNELIHFLRKPDYQIWGYTADKDTFKLLSKAVLFPEKMWYPKQSTSGKPYQYRYQQPATLHDGLATGYIQNSGLDAALLSDMMNKIGAGKYPGVHSMLIIKNGQLVFEEYFYEYTIDSLHELRSASKSFVSALTGLAIQKGYIKSKNNAVLSYFPGYVPANNSPLKQKITVEHLLTNQSGLDCDISNPKSEGNETKMNYSDDWVKFTLDLPMIDTPGGKGMYCSGNPITLGRIIEKASGRPLPAFAQENLFTPMGITHFKWNFKPDKSNAEDFCQLYLSPRDMAKFGLMYLNGGKWHGKQIVPQNWVTASGSKHSVVQGVNYGYLWWLKYLDANGVRYNSIAAQGNGGQKIYLFPAQDMVVVTTGGNYNSQSPSDELIQTYILPSFNKKL
ncbi:serine hydrolase domain-containing protein [Mucilaginibacter lacusdianchii]|uniref:serine hydrolase domain-containing protein n=1 Tax=Mucilaginibacter lacusdianchii TaxID=2684211 RepID=UPI00131D9053|nr:serine hydrolase [Mucilaginibacter sp. JXJ CY 39]